MAENTPPGSRPARPFVPPFRRPVAPDAGAPIRSPAGPAGGAPRPIAPPVVGRPPAGLSPNAPRPTLPPRPIAPIAPVAPRPAAPEAEPVDGLGLEHAISEILGQGEGGSAPVPGLEVERAGEGHGVDLSDLADGTPSSGPDLPFLPTGDEDRGAGARPPSEHGSSESMRVVERALAAEGERRAAASPDTAGLASEEPPTSSEPLPWLAAPAGLAAGPGAGPLDGLVEPSRAPHEIATPTLVAATLYEPDARSGVNEPSAMSSALQADAGDARSTIVGANVAVAAALERVAERVRNGELPVPAVAESSGDAGALAAALAVLLGARS